MGEIGKIKKIEHIHVGDKIYEYDVEDPIIHEELIEKLKSEGRLKESSVISAENQKKREYRQLSRAERRAKYPNGVPRDLKTKKTDADIKKLHRPNDVRYSFTDDQIQEMKDKEIRHKERPNIRWARQQIQASKHLGV